MGLISRRRSRRLPIGRVRYANHMQRHLSCLLPASCTIAIIPQLRIQADHVGLQNLELKNCSVIHDLMEHYARCSEDAIDLIDYHTAGAASLVMESEKIDGSALQQDIMLHNKTKQWSEET
ncbi:unnamed protein product [Urochloa humidicola]